MAKCRTRRHVAEALHAAGLSSRKAADLAFPLMRALDARGLLIVAHEPNPTMLLAAMKAMHRTAYIPGTAAQRNSHKMAIRFRAAIEAERTRQGLATATHAQPEETASV